MLYVAAPYSHEDPAVREARFDAVCRLTAELIRQGKPAFSPVAYSHPLCRYGLPLSWDFWQKHDLRFLEMCSEVVVLKLPGWTQSVGVQAEIAAARAMGKPVTFLEPVGLCNSMDPPRNQASRRSWLRSGGPHHDDSLECKEYV